MCGICGGQTGTGTSFLQVVQFSVSLSLHQSSLYSFLLSLMLYNLSRAQCYQITHLKIGIKICYSVLRHIGSYLWILDEFTSYRIPCY